MKVTADISLIPIGTDVSLSKYVAAACDELAAAGFDCHTHAFGTNVEGEYADVCDAVGRAIERVLALGSPRVAATIKFGCRSDRVETLAEKVASVAAKRRPAAGSDNGHNS